MGGDVIQSTLIEIAKLAIGRRPFTTLKSGYRSLPVSLSKREATLSKQGRHLAFGFAEIQSRYVGGQHPRV